MLSKNIKFVACLLNKRFLIAERMYNTMTKFALNQLNKMKENKEYQKEFENYLNCKSNGYHEKAKESSKALKKYQQQYSLSEYQFHRFIKVQQQRYKKNIDSNTAQKIATQAWQAVESVLYRKGKKLHLKKI